jgi:hypothetical protein
MGREIVMLRGKTTGQFLPIPRDGKIPIGSSAFNSSPGAQWPTHLSGQIERS